MMSEIKLTNTDLDRIERDARMAIQGPFTPVKISMTPQMALVLIEEIRDLRTALADAERERDYEQRCADGYHKKWQRVESENDRLQKRMETLENDVKNLDAAEDQAIAMFESVEKKYNEQLEKADPTGEILNKNKDLAMQLVVVEQELTDLRAQIDGAVTVEIRRNKYGDYTYIVNDTEPNKLLNPGETRTFKLLPVTDQESVE